jgi:3-deoxy-D-manno-octulosonate 8-phosphate phosphatase (KDO 8-P phosphatase)
VEDKNYLSAAISLFNLSAMELFKSITTFIFDVDGVLTDGTILVLENGVQARRMSIKDGYALQLAVKKGYRLLVISGAASSPVVDRLNKLGVTDIHMGIADKKAYVKNFIANKNLTAEQVLFMGDDMPDLGPMSIVGLPVCPADAVTEIKEIVKYISPLNGGYGCVRDVIEKVLKLRNDWQPADEITSR